MNVHPCGVRFNRDRAAVVEAIALAIFDEGVSAAVLPTEIGRAVLDHLHALRRAAEARK